MKSKLHWSSMPSHYGSQQMSFDFQPACVHMVGSMKTSCHNRDKMVGKSYIWAACSQSRTCCLIMWLDIAITTWLIINVIFSVSLCFSFLLLHILTLGKRKKNPPPYLPPEVSDSPGPGCVATPLTYLFWLMLSDVLFLYDGCFYSFLLKLFVLNFLA